MMGMTVNSLSATTACLRLDIGEFVIIKQAGKF